MLARQFDRLALVPLAAILLVPASVCGDTLEVFEGHSIQDAIDAAEGRGFHSNDTGFKTVHLRVVCVCVCVCV